MGLKKLFLIFSLMALGAFCFAETKVPSWGYVGSSGKLVNTETQGGDGFYAQFTVSNDSDFYFLVIEMKGNMIKQSYADIGRVENLVKVDDKTLTYSVNNHKYKQHLYTGDDGKTYLWIKPLDIADNLTFYFCSTDQ